MSALLGEWQAVRGGDGPRVVAVLGEPGLGKTRLVQTFFAAISSADGNGYWPPVLARHGNNLQVNPAPDPARAGEPPFLWWGVRLVDPLSANSIGTGTLAASVETHLSPQLAPFRHHARRRDRRREALSIGKGVALDLVIDIVPFGGLAKTLAEAGADLHRIYREDRADGAAAPAGSLIDGVLDDLGAAIAPGSGASRPAVFVIDDGQHAPGDPGVTAFAAALLARAVRGRWPLLVVVTHWEREWGSPVPGSLVDLLETPGRAVRTLRLAPLPDLSPLLDAGLPGLARSQRAALLERADGNPRFLGEMVLFAQGSRGLFHESDPAGHLTDRGLHRLLERSTTLHDLTAARLRESPPEVQDAVCLASLQGVEFLNAILGGTAEKLPGASPSVATAVGAAERPHAYVRAIDSGVAAFAQRIYYEVAVEHLEGAFDPDEARAALEGSVRDIMTTDRSRELGGLERRRLLGLAAALFEGAEPVSDRMIAGHCLHSLARIAEADGDLHAWRALARRLDALILRSGDDVLDADLDWLRLIYIAASGPDAHEVEARVVEQMCRLTAEAFEDDGNDWTRWMHVRALALLAEHHLNWSRPEPAIEAALGARALLDDWPLAERTPEELMAWIEVYGAVARALTLLGNPGQAIGFHEGQMLVAERMMDLDPGNAAAAQVRAFADQRVGRLAWEVGDTAQAIRHLESAVARWRTLSAEGRISDEMPMSLCNLAQAVEAGRPSEAAALRAEAVERARDLVARSDDADHRHALAWALLQTARGTASDPVRAYDLAAEAAALHDRDDGDASAEQAALIEGFAATIRVLAGFPADALPHAIRARDRARDAAAWWPTPAARRTHLAALIQLARIEQSLGDYGSAALHLAEAETALAGIVDPGGVADLAEALRQARTGQPRIH
jgi:hypothetical protein